MSVKTANNFVWQSFLNFNIRREINLLCYKKYKKYQIMLAKVKIKSTYEN